MLIEPKLYNMDQSWNYETLWELSKGKVRQKVKVEIRRNAYDFQSYGRAYLFSPTDLKWSCVATTAGPQLHCLDLSYTTKDILVVTRDHLPALKMDVFRLLSEVGRILDVEVTQGDIPGYPKEKTHG